MIKMWVVYDHPRDLPNMFVARLFVGEQPTESIIMASSLEMLRHVLMVDMGLACITRSPEDDPKIVETWL